MNWSRVGAPVLALCLSLPVGAQPANAADPRDSVVVTGRGEVFGTPDMMSADFAVETDAATVGAALKTSATAATRMRNALVEAGIARTDLQTSNVSITSRTNDDRKIIGYTVNQGLTAKIRNLPKAGAILSAAVAAGGDAARLNGVSFTIEKNTALLAEARGKAFADARGKAELYAKQAGRQLGQVVRVNEAEPGYFVPGAQDGLAAAGSRFVVEPGQQRMAATVTVEWAFR
ncbi:SIMPL domain-containing protein [Paractinoplanes ferrugineus]|uniref:Conserved lipoprotein LpqG n=1 Tax=Paractinoplanes ferrugineus TaxID=113564 RepID=A0A919IYV9_9ACTN|nr:SIMPL domain-containing protein [Actinoplanes ferrugineus]GIE10970.1 putative conserved lipoprotein LpqG [Actinoplanes ferrugineus]